MMTTKEIFIGSKDHQIQASANEQRRMSECVIMWIVKIKSHLIILARSFCYMSAGERSAAATSWAGPGLHHSNWNNKVLKKNSQVFSRIAKVMHTHFLLPKHTNPNQSTTQPAKKNAEAEEHLHSRQTRTWTSCFSCSKHKADTTFSRYLGHMPGPDSVKISHTYSV